jgi:hypothetical protein
MVHLFTDAASSWQYIAAILNPLKSNGNCKYHPN